MSMKVFSISLLIILKFGASSACAQSYTVCEGEYEGNCAYQHDGYAYCGSVAALAKQICRQSNGTGDSANVEINSHDGNKCGYGLWRITCK